jgi:hypothetical protein
VRRTLVALVAVLAPLGAFAQSEPDSVGARIQDSALAAQSYQGPLDGAWTLVSTSGQAILAFQLVDKVGGAAPLEGVWRDLRRPATPGDIHFVDAIVRGPTSLTITLNASPGSPPLAIALQSGPDGGWSGTMNENGAATPVRLRRS